MNFGLCTIEWALIRSNIWKFFSVMEEETFGHQLQACMCSYLHPSPWTLVSPGENFWWGCCRIYMWVSLLALCAWITQVRFCLIGHMIPESVVVSLSLLGVHGVFTFSVLTPFLKLLQTCSPVTVWPHVIRLLLCPGEQPWLDVSILSPIAGRRTKAWRCHAVHQFRQCRKAGNLHQNFWVLEPRQFPQGI